MNISNPDQEPLNNVALESAIFGLRMALTPEEEVEARERFLAILRDSTLAVPTAKPVATAPDGSILPNAEISLLIATNQDGVSGVPAFTTLGGLRTTLPQMENGMFLAGGELGRILGGSPHRLFVDGPPDLHAEVETVELQRMAAVTQQLIQAQQQAAAHNTRLEDALAGLRDGDTPAARDAVVTAFMEGYCRYPLLSESEQEAGCVILSQHNPDPAAPMPEIRLLTQDDNLVSFTSEQTLLAWDATPRNAIVLPGVMIAQLAVQAEIAEIHVNPGHPSAQTLRVEQGRVVVAGG